MNREDENQFVESHFQLIEESDFVKEFKIQAKIYIVIIIPVMNPDPGLKNTQNFHIFLLSANHLASFMCPGNPRNHSRKSFFHNSKICIK